MPPGRPAGLCRAHSHAWPAPLRTALRSPYLLNARRTVIRVHVRDSQPFSSKQTPSHTRLSKAALRTHRSAHPALHQPPVTSQASTGASLHRASCPRSLASCWYVLRVARVYCEPTTLGVCRHWCCFRAWVCMCASPAWMWMRLQSRWQRAGCSARLTHSQGGRSPGSVCFP